MKVKNIQKFTDRFEKIVRENIDPEQLIPVLEIDTELQLSEINSIGCFWGYINQVKIKKL